MRQGSSYPRNSYRLRRSAADHRVLRTTQSAATGATPVDEHTKKNIIKYLKKSTSIFFIILATLDV